MLLINTKHNMKYFLPVILFISVALQSCVNSDYIATSMDVESNDRTSSGLLSFASVDELAGYANKIGSDSHTKSLDCPSDFVSLWDSMREKVMSSLSPQELLEIEQEGLYYEPEDEIIPDPVFAKIVNSNREVKVSGKIYRYVSSGVLIYGDNVDKSVINDFDPSEFEYLQDKDEVNIGNDVVFVRLLYGANTVDCASTKAPILEPGLYDNELVLQSGTRIPSADIRKVEYEKGAGDSNGLQKTIASIFGTSVTAENLFDEKHRMKLRTFSQDYLVYTSVGMTVRMQQKKLGIWWRTKAQEFRYGWTGVECYYTYKGPSFPTGVTFLNTPVILQDNTNYYEEPLVLFTVPLIDYQVTDQRVSSLLKSLLNKNKSKINSWLNNNPNYKSSPQSVFAADTKNSYRMIFPQYEEMATDDGREKINWDFRVHFQVGVKISSGGVSPTFSPVGDPHKIEIRRGEIYAAVKYDDKWKACAIIAK